MHVAQNWHSKHFEFALRYNHYFLLLQYWYIKDFGSIFSTLLPGANAKLAPPEGMCVLDGLEVKVAFGSVWKESLTELSGGQRYVFSWILFFLFLILWFYLEAYFIFKFR